jgi:O-methyltransferase
MNSLYLDLLKRCLTRSLFPDKRYEPPDTTRALPYSHALRFEGRDWPVEALTMVGMKRLECLQNLLTTALLDHEIPGDVVECGVWRGGASIFMRAVLVALGHSARRVWLFDSFQGLPKPRDKGDLDLSMHSDYLGVSLSQVQDGFRQFGLLSERVNFVPGWFKDTLPNAPVQQIVLLRLDGDMYESTMEGLESLYSKISSGGFVVIDDYGALPVCQRAVADFRRSRGVNAPIVPIDWTGVYWQVD